MSLKDSDSSLKKEQTKNILYMCQD
ncbi:UNVERIFIED_CONTAM: hypothetical protein GTU68_064277 [Idotea baltica]|nr:hypothetical protein [Idotea baltica]